jgi:hypothetical protein
VTASDKVPLCPRWSPAGRTPTDTRDSRRLCRTLHRRDAHMWHSEHGARGTEDVVARVEQVAEVRLGHKGEVVGAEIRQARHGDFRWLEGAARTRQL